MIRGRRVLAALVALSSLPAAALELPDVSTAQDEQHDWVQRNAGAPSQQLDLETQLAYVAGNVNFSLVQQIEGVGNRAELEQIGTGNLLAVMQGFGDGNLAFVQQVGDDNYAVVSQGGDNNVIGSLSQVGNNNRATISQQGSNNSVMVSHVGDNNTLELRQVDSYNQATVEQHGDTDILITQSNPGGSAASMNVLDFKAYTEPGAGLLAHNVSIDGPDNRQIYLCNGSPAYCDSVLP